MPSKFCFFIDLIWVHCLPDSILSLLQIHKFREPILAARICRHVDQRDLNAGNTQLVLQNTYVNRTKFESEIPV